MTTLGVFAYPPETSTPFRGDMRAFHLKIRSVRPRKTGNNKVLPNLLVGRAERDSAR
jgi:hypothetical protein